MTFARRQRRAKKNTVSMPLISMFHHSQLPATPLLATMPVTTRGVSAANVVATIDAPASHHATCRPEMKYSSRLSPPRFVYIRPMPADNAKYATTINQSITVRCMIASVRVRRNVRPQHHVHHGIRERAAHGLDLVVVSRRVHAVRQQDD